MRFGTTELMVILIVVIIIFGPTQIPKLTKMLGKSVKSIREGLEKAEGNDEDKPNESKLNASSEKAKKRVNSTTDMDEEE